MPYKSKAQEAYFNMHRKEIGNKVVNEFNKASKGKKLPERVDMQKHIESLATMGNPRVASIKKAINKGLR